MSAARAIAPPAAAAHAGDPTPRPAAPRPVRHDLAALGASLVGARLGERYDVEAVLGAGGMGCVLAARHHVTRRRVALKVVPYDAATDPAVAARFALEAQAPCALDHPNVVEVLDAGADAARGLLYVAQELLEGESLERHLLARGRLPWQEALAIVVPIAGALAAAHAAGLTHRDVKPPNVHLARVRGVLVPKLLDWGIARASWSPHVTVAGQVFGTPVYMAPEQIHGEPDVGPQADVWALGVLLHECIAGAPPFEGPDYNATLAAVLTAPLPRLDVLVPGVPPGLAEVVARALARDRARRWASVDALLAGLALAVDLPGLPWVAVAPPTTPAPALGDTDEAVTQRFVPPSLARARWLLALGLAAVVAGLGLERALPAPVPVPVATHAHAVAVRPAAARTTPASAHPSEPAPVVAATPAPVAPTAPVVHATRPSAAAAPHILATRAPARLDAGRRELLDPWTPRAPASHNGAPLLEP